LSKFNRIVDWVASRPQIQEEMTYAIASQVENLIFDKSIIDKGPDESGSNCYQTPDLGVAVLVQAEHFCLTHRGVREHDSAMTTSVLRGKFLQKPNLKSEFFDIVKLMQDKK
jgi:GTP cyclohydrolase I